MGEPIPDPPLSCFWLGLQCGFTGSPIPGTHSDTSKSDLEHYFDGRSAHGIGFVGNIRDMVRGGRTITPIPAPSLAFDTPPTVFHCEQERVL